MISLEQVRALEDRVEKAVSYIASLREEGAELRRRLAETQSFVDVAVTELAEAEEKVLAATAAAEAAAEQKAAAAEEKQAAAEKRADAVEELRLAEAQAVAGRVRELESRLADMAERVAAAETRAAELSARAEEYRKDQSKIEEGIVHALRKLDSFEDLVLSAASPSRGLEAQAPIEEPATEPVAVSAAVSATEPATEGSGIAVKAAPEAEVEIVENELDIF